MGTIQNGAAGTAGAAGSGSSPKSISNSARFRAAGPGYLQRTPTIEGNRQKFTWSGWVKRSTNASGTYYSIFAAGIGSGGNDGIFFDSTSVNGALYFTWNGGTNALISSALFRDFSAWYHVVVAVDTTQAGASDRVKMYVNGQQITEFSLAQYPDQNSSTTYINTTNIHRIGGHTNSATLYHDGYMAEVHFVDGQ